MIISVLASQVRSGWTPVIDICRNEAGKNEIYRPILVSCCRGETFGGSPSRV